MKIPVPTSDPSSATPGEKARMIQAVERGNRSKWWRRNGTKKSGFRYHDAAGRAITDQAHLDRISALVIPPAWKHVRISPSASGRLQALGIDGMGRLQYLYHSKFREKREKAKYKKIEEFGRHLPKLRRAANKHFKIKGFPREKVLALMVRLVNQLYFRAGAGRSVKQYRTYGITTLQNRHLKIERQGTLIFDFVGKSHIKHRKVLVDPEIAGQLAKLKELGPSRKLFHYLDNEGNIRPVTASDLNAYIKALTTRDFSVKDFRTWGGTVMTAAQLARKGPAEDERGLKKNIVAVIKNVAETLGNTPTVCRSSYVHPLVLKAYESGTTIRDFIEAAKEIRSGERGLDLDERLLLRLFENAAKGG